MICSVVVIIKRCKRKKMDANFYSPPQPPPAPVAYKPITTASYTGGYRPPFNKQIHNNMLTRSQSSQIFSNNNTSTRTIKRVMQSPYPQQQSYYYPYIKQ